jgi:hypothetical protein
MTDSFIPALPCMCGSFRRTSRALTQLYDRALRPLDLRPTQLTILQVLSRAGATASFVAWKLANPAHPNSFVLWQLLGIADLVIAVSVGTTAGLIDPQGPTMAPMTVLPLSLIPTFLVPLFLILHVVCIAQARSWKVASEPTQMMNPAQRTAI